MGWLPSLRATGDGDGCKLETVVVPRIRYGFTAVLVTTVWPALLVHALLPVAPTATLFVVLLVLPVVGAVVKESTPEPSEGEIAGGVPSSGFSEAIRGEALLLSELGKATSKRANTCVTKPAKGWSAPRLDKKNEEVTWTGQKA
jgi:hypothetical protein